MLQLPTQLIRLETTDSTNSYLANLIRKGVPVGAAVIAQEQTQGRGQLGRMWFSPKGTSLYMSVSWRRDDGPEGLPFAVGFAIARTLIISCSVQARVRWPNDIVVNSRKIGGVLIESSPVAGVWIIGCGVNINTPEFPPELEDTAVSAFLETGQRQSLQNVEDTLFAELTTALNGLVENGPQDALSRWRTLDVTSGSAVRVRKGADERVMEAAGVDDSGRLVARSGERYEVIIGASTVFWEPVSSQAQPDKQCQG